MSEMVLSTVARQSTDNAESAALLWQRFSAILPRVPVGIRQIEDEGVDSDVFFFFASFLFHVKRLCLQGDVKAGGGRVRPRDGPLSACV